MSPRFVLASALKRRPSFNFTVTREGRKFGIIAVNLGFSITLTLSEKACIAGSRIISQVKLATPLERLINVEATAKGTENLPAKVFFGLGSDSSAARE